jgi:hypothetical protein
MKEINPEEFREIISNFSRNGVPVMVSESINALAGEASRLQKENIQNTMEVRSPRYTLGSLKYFKANPRKNIEQINAVVGSISPYLPVQDSGGEVSRVKGKSKNIPITRNSRSGGSMSGKVLRRYRMDKVFGGSTGAFVLHVKKYDDFKGVFIRVKGKLRLLQKLSEKSVMVRETNWHKDAIERASVDIGLIDKVLIGVVRKYMTKV